jgi:hypothetical protein
MAGHGIQRGQTWTKRIAAQVQLLQCTIAKGG